LQTEKQASDQLSEQALIVYKALYDQVGFLKKQQWTITNYVLLVYGAIFVAKRELPASVLELLPLATIVACLWGLAALIFVQVDLWTARDRLNTANRRVFGSKERIDLGIKEERLPFWRGMEFTGALMLVLVIGAAIVVYRS
jgi:hypothetical protein